MSLCTFKTQVGGLCVDVARDEDEEGIIAAGTHGCHQRMLFDGNEVIPDFLWVGAVRCTRSDEQLQARGIRRVVNLSKRRLSPFVEQRYKCAEVDVVDNASQLLFSTWKRVFAILDDAQALREPVLVCCHRGISRSVSTVAAFLMYSQQNEDWQGILRSIQHVRPMAAPNYEFCRQLYAFGVAKFDCEEAERRYAELTADFSQNVQLQQILQDTNEDGRPLCALDSTVDDDLDSVLSTPSTMLSSCMSRGTTISSRSSDSLHGPRRLFVPSAHEEGETPTTQRGHRSGDRTNPLTADILRLAQSRTAVELSASIPHTPGSSSSLEVELDSLQGALSRPVRSGGAAHTVGDGGV